MTKETRALIEAAENHISYCRCGGTRLYSYVPDSIAATDCAVCAELRAAISSAKAAEEGVETADDLYFRSRVRRLGDINGN